MAQVQPSPNNAQPPTANGQPPSTASNPQVGPISWDNDRMFNVYIHDYFLKRGFQKAAKEFALEAQIGNDVSPPINARLGFLFEWWSVFWLFFNAKTSRGPDHVMTYFQWLQQTERGRLHENDPRRIIQMPLAGQQPPRGIARPPPNGVRPPGMVNGTVPMPQAPGQPTPPAQGLQYPMGVPHGPIPPAHQQPLPGPGQSQPQINGIVDPSVPHGHPMSNPQRPPSQQQQNRTGPHGSLSQQPQGHPPPSHPSAVPHLQPSQRQLSRGQHEVMRPPGGQFHSPTMGVAHPPGPGQQGPLGHPHMPGMGGPMPQMGVPSNAQHLPPHLGRGPPPQGGQPNTASPRNPSQTPTQQYQQLMNPGGTMGPPQPSGSRSATPGGSLLTHQSPALAAREPPPQGQGQGQSVNEEMTRRFQQQHHQHLQHQHQRQQQQQQQQQHQHQQQQQQHQQQQQEQQQQQQQRNNQSDQPELANMELDLQRIPQVFLAQMKQEAGVNDRDVQSLTFDEKNRLNEVFKKTMAAYNGVPNQARNGRSGMGQPPMSGMPMGGPPQGPQSRQPPTAMRGQKRASTSPGDEGAGESTPKDQSPPERKRQRHSPQGGVGQTPGGTDAGAPPPPPMGSMVGFPPSHPGAHPGGYPGPASVQHPPPNLPNGFRGGQMGPMGPGTHPGQHPVPNVGGINMGGMPPGMVHPIPPGMAHMPPALTNQHTHQMPNSQVGAPGRPPLSSPEMSYPFQNQSQQMQQQLHFRQTLAPQHHHKMPPAQNPANPNPSPSSDAHDAARGGPGGATAVGNRPPQQGKPGSMMPPPSPAHRAENANVQKGAGMMPPPAQPASAPGNTGVTSKEQTAPSPAGGRHDGAAVASPSIRPTSGSGAGASTGANAPSAPPSMNPGSGGGPATPASAGGNNSSANTTAPSPSAILTNRISPSAAMNSLPRPQTSGPDASSASATVQQQQPPAPAPPGPAPPSAAPGGTLQTNLFGDFFDPMEDNFGLDSLDSIDPAEFSQWIDMNPLN